MRTLTKFFRVATVAGLLGATSVAVAQPPPTNSAPAARMARPRAKSVAGVVAAVDNDGKTITLKNHDKPFSVTSKTRISKEGQPATLSDIMAGDKVTLRARDDENGNPVATSIRDGRAKPKPEAAPVTPGATNN